MEKSIENTVPAATAAAITTTTASLRHPVLPSEDDQPSPPRPRIIGGVLCEDYRIRPPWAATDPLARAYHDTTWGHRPGDDNEAFEALCFQVFQAGLSLRVVLSKWDALAEAFYDFDIDQVAAMTDDEIDALLEDPALIRNRRKMEAVVTNARVAAEGLGTTDSLLLLGLDHACAEDLVPATMADIPETTPAAEDLAARMKELGYAFIGPKSAWQWLQATGFAQTHLQDSWRRQKVA